MVKRFFPRQGKFFDLFRQLADLIVEGANQFRNMLDDLQHLESHSRTIKDTEHKADEVTHKTVELLHKTFITPLDREDIHLLTSRMDDIMDYIEAASARMYLYNITVAPPEFVELADICVKSAVNIRTTVNRLEDLKNPAEIINCCIEVNRLENEADHILRSAMVKLFRDEPDTRQLIKLKEILELLESVTDRCEDVANIIEGIVLEHA